MARSLSEDLRFRVVEAVEAGASRRQAAARFGVGVSSAIRWVRASRERGHVRAKPQGGDRRPHRIEAQAWFLLDRIAALEARRDELEREEFAAALPAPSLRLHPGLSEIYRRKVAQLEEALNDESIRTPAGEVLRSLIDRIELLPHEDGSGLDALLYGELAAILAFCEEGEQKKKLPGTDVPGSQLSVVAGARNQLYLLLAASRIPLVTFEQPPVETAAS